MSELSRSERRVLLALKHGPAMTAVIRHAVDAPPTPVLKALAQRGLVRKANSRAWELTSVGRDAIR